MSLWDTYNSRLNAHGGDRRAATLQREQRFLAAKIPNSLSYHQLIVDGVPRSMSIINSDNLNMKTLCTVPGETLPYGGVVAWMNQHWIITEVDVNNEVYTKGVMQQCNYQLCWIADDKSIQKRWCIVEDGTKYLTGEYGDNDYIITRGDSRISLTIPKDKYTIRFNRDNRFLIDDYASPSVLAYRLTKPFKLGAGSGDGGVISLVLQECNTEDTDNFELHIANYYDYFPRKYEVEEPIGPIGEEREEQSGKKVWL